MSRSRRKKPLATDVVSIPLYEHGNGQQQKECHSSGRSWFSRVASCYSQWTGKPIAFLLALTIIIVWAVTGPLFHYSDTWQLVINTGTTIITFLMVFVIQNSQNRDTAAMQIKLDESIHAMNGARNTMLDLEELDDSELAAFRAQFLQIAELARQRDQKGSAPSTERPSAAERN